MSHAAAVALVDLVAPTGAEQPGRLVRTSEGERSRRGPLHAMGDGATLCGLGTGEVTVLRQLFRVGDPDACPACLAGAR